MVLSLSLTLLLCGCSRAHESPAPEPRVVHPGDADVIGDWRGCGIGLRVNMDGTASGFLDYAPCTLEGTWTLDGTRMSISWRETSTCDEVRDTTHTYDVVRARVLEVDTLDLTDVEGGRRWSYAREGAMPVRRWSADGAESELAIEGRNVFEVLGTPGEGAGAGCYWSSRECDGVLSCGGSVESWTVVDGALRASTACGGDCWCRASIEGRVAGDGSIDATFDSENCARTFAGTLRFAPVALDH